MFHNYFFLKRLARSLVSYLKGFTLVECFSQNKNELIFRLASDDQTRWICANLDPNISLLAFPLTYQRAGKNSVNLFTELLNRKITGIRAFNFERSFLISLSESYSLIFKMHGRRANALLVRDDEVVEIFRRVLAADFDVRPGEMDKKIDLTECAFQEAGYNPNALIPALGKEFKDLWIENYRMLSDHEKWPVFKNLLEQLEKTQICLIEGHKPRISLLAEQGSIVTSDPVHAANWLYEKTIHYYYFEKEKASWISQLQRQVRRSENYLLEAWNSVQLIQSRRDPKELANIIMANLDMMSTGLERVALHDLYRNDLIEIPLNKKLSPQENAEKYYRKSKRKGQDIKNLIKNIAEKEEHIKDLKQQIEEIAAISDHKTLKACLRSGKKEKAIRNKQNKNFHKLTVDGWQVLIGKNAKANDELTLRTAKKDDLWLHAKDVSGSHVIIKQMPGQNFPRHIIEEAAAIAAFYSKRKTETVCPVIYTFKKNVRKLKGAPSGQVMVEKENIVMAIPQKPIIPIQA